MALLGMLPIPCFIFANYRIQLKVISIVIFFFLGIAVNAGGNTSHEYIGEGRQFKALCTARTRRGIAGK
jgi:amino acid permease